MGGTWDRGQGTGDRVEKGEGGRKGRELGYPPHYDRSAEDVEEGVIPTGNQRPQPRHLTPERSRRVISGVRPRARERMSKRMEWEETGNDA